MKKNFFLLTTLLLIGSSTSASAASQVDLPGPVGSGEFGSSVTVLPNGNFVVTDPSFDQSSPVVEDIGAVYLYNPQRILISRLTGGNANDKVGSRGVTVLANGNFVVKSFLWNGSRGAVTWGHADRGFIGGSDVVVSPANSLVGTLVNDHVGSYDVTTLTNGHYVVSSPDWNNGENGRAGAVTWGNGITGITGPVTPTNSLVGTSSGEQVGITSVIALTNGNYVVSSPGWTNGFYPSAGAVTWGNGSTGISGPVTSTNSLVGSSNGDQVGDFPGVTALTNGNYVVSSYRWDNGATEDVGAVTWGNGITGTSGSVTPTNSLVGTSALDHVGYAGVIALNNGNYVVSSPDWNNGTIKTAGAVTWGNGSTGTSGPVTPINSLVGTSTYDHVGGEIVFGGYARNDVIALTNGNYVVNSSYWDNRNTGNVGAVTWGNGSTGISGPVTATNSLVGTSTLDRVGYSGVTALTNGNYVVNSSYWNNGATEDVGAVTWGNGITGTRGPVTPTNSLVGTSALDRVGYFGVTALNNGNYVVSSYRWDNGATEDVGAVTWGNGSTGTSGPVTPTNSLFGTSANDQVGGEIWNGFYANSVIALTNGNYVVISKDWDNRSTENVGAVTWGNGSTGIHGPVSPTNSLVGALQNDAVGSGGVTVLTNGNYVVRSLGWDNGDAVDAGSVTWGAGSTGISGAVTLTNSLVGTSTNNEVGRSGITALTNGYYVVNSPYWDNGATADAGAVSLSDGQMGTTGPVSNSNSVLGTAGSGGSKLVFGYDPARHQLIVGRPDSNLVTLFFGDRLRSLGKSSQDAPGAADIAFSKPGFTAVNTAGSALTDFALIGSGAASGKNSALFAFDPVFGADMVLQSGASLSTLGGGLPFNAVASALSGQLFQQPQRALFQTTVKGTGITTANNRLLLQDNGSGVSLLHRTGSPIAALGGASLSSFSEVLQSHDQDLITVAYKLKSGGEVSAANDEGLLFLNHNGTVSANIAAREGQAAFGGGGNFGSFNGRAAAGLGSVIHFTALFKPAGLAAPVPAVFSTTVDGVTTARLAKAGDTHTSSGSASFKSFTAISQQDGNALFKATLNNSPTSQNEGLFRLPAPGLLSRKGDPIGGGLTISSILRFWPAGFEQVILQVQLTGLGVKSSNNQALLLRQSDGTYLTLLRTGLPAPGTGPATLATISAVEVNPVTGLYAVLGTLGGASATSNQALWTGNPILPLGSPASEQLPKLTLRKGNTYRTEVTPQGVIHSLALKPATDPTGAGGRGLAQALAANGDLAIFITGDRNLTEVVLLDR